MITNQMNTLNLCGGSSPLTSYMLYVGEEGIDVERFVECGGRLVQRDDPAVLARDLSGVEKKITLLETEHPRLAAQLQLLAGFIAGHAATAPETLRNEAVFALLYGAKEMDLIPDNLPAIGYVDDAAVVEVVLTRYAEFFERYCFAHDLEWEVLKPGVGC